MTMQDILVDTEAIQDISRGKRPNRIFWGIRNQTGYFGGLETKQDFLRDKKPNRIF
jgi:hypothetical protein